MITIPLYIFLICYLLYLLVFLLFSLANVYHLISTGTFTFIAFTVTSIVSVWCITILIFTYTALVDINWYSNLILFGPAGFMLYQ